MREPTAEDVFAWADKFSDYTHRLHRMRELRAAINEVGTVCGDCNSWMTRACPRERNVNGMNHGPSCKSKVGNCPVFTLKSWDAKRKEELIQELKKLEDSHG